MAGSRKVSARKVIMRMSDNKATMGLCTALTQGRSGKFQHEEVGGKALG
jgi:hypothetical protein